MYLFFKLHVTLHSDAIETVAFQIFLEQWKKGVWLLLLSWLALDALARQSLISLTPEILSGCIADKLVHLAHGQNPAWPQLGPLGPPSPLFMPCQTKSKYANHLNFKLERHIISSLLNCVRMCYFLHFYLCLIGDVPNWISNFWSCSSFRNLVIAWYKWS